MRWRKLRRSSNVDDIRGRGGASRGMSLLPLLFLARGRGLIVIVVVLVIAYFVGGPEMLTAFLGGEPAPSSIQTSAPVDDEAGQFVAAILGSTEDEWRELFAASGRTYQPPRLTLFTSAVQSACGYATAATGPFYCPADQRVYLDTSFFDDLARLGGPGDFAQAYVIGHEIGHHVQTLLGVSGEVRGAQREVDQASANRLQVAMELQADCYAGVWAHHANRGEQVLEPGDVQEGLAAASAIGDDRLQREAGRRVTPDSFTHGSAAERREWLGRGLETGDPGACDTFASF